MRHSCHKFANRAVSSKVSFLTSLMETWKAGSVSTSRCDSSIGFLTRLLYLTMSNPKDRKADLICMSGCALIFMAGSKTDNSGDDPRTDRILEVGGTIGFHAPYDALGQAKFIAGVKAVRELRIKLGDAI